MAGPEKKYLYLLESIKKGVICEDTYNEIEEIIDVSARLETKREVNRILKKKAPTDE